MTAANPAHGLASVQQVIWLDQMLNPDVPHYNIGGCWEVTGVLDLARFEAAIQEAVDAHDALRLVLDDEAGVAVQRALPRVTVDVRHVDVSAHVDAEDRARAYLREIGGAPFALHGALLWEDHLIRLGPARVWWVHRAHHVIADAVSLAVFGEAVMQIYERMVAADGGAPAPAASPDAPSYVEVLARDREYLASSRFRTDEEFWTQRFAELPPVLLAPRDGRVMHEAAPSRRLLWAIDAARLARLRQIAGGYGATVQHVMHALLAVYFARTQGVDDIVFGVPVHNRSTGRDRRSVGVFSSMIPVRVQVDCDRTFGELVRGVAAELRRCYRYQRFPLADLNRALRLAQVGRKQLFDAIVAAVPFPAPRQVGGATFTVDKLYCGFAQVPLAMFVRDYAGRDDTVIELDTNTLAFRPGELEDLQRRLERMLDAVLAAGGEHVIGALPLIDGAERALVVAAWNATQQAYPQARCLHELFEAQAVRTPDTIAVVDGERAVRYGELNAQANRLAAQLRALGVDREVRVALCLERSAEMVVCLLATLKAGGCYVPIDPAYPVERVREIVEDAAPRVALVDAAGARVMAEIGDPDGLARLHVTADAARWGAAPAHDVPLPDGAERWLAYVIYTSGSTGRPKGVMNEHRGVVNRILWGQATYRLTADDVVLQKTPYCFDVSGWEFYWPLMAGARLVMAEPGGHKDPSYLCALIQRTGVTTLHFVPSMLHEFLAHDAVIRCTSIDRVMCSGEVLPAAAVRRFEAVLPWAELHNLYGPTEAAIEVTAWECSAWHANGQRRAVIPIGRPIANTQIYILDPRRQPVPIGAAGEIYIGGVQVARGYLNQPALTAERFVDDPFTPRQRLYRTGDLGRWLADGTIEYLGRNDLQIKIRGFRIELGEIEGKLAQIPGVREVVVIVRDDAAAGGRLVAYYVGDDRSDALRAHALRGLPPHMVPSAYVRLAALPVTPSGKLDRKALPAPDSGAPARSYDAPRSEIEHQLAAMWAELLQVERIGRDDNFFALGGHSLLAVRLIERMRRARLHADARLIFTAPTLAALAAAARASRDEPPVRASGIPRDARRITPDMLPLVELGQVAIDAIVATVEGGAANVQDIYPLAPMQDGILFHHLLQPEGDPYVIAGVFGFRSKPRLDRFVAALQQVIDRHDVLRTAIAWEGLDEPVQIVQRRATLAVSIVEIAADAPDAAAQLEAQFDPRRQRLDLRRAPLLRCYAAHDRAGGRWLLRILCHHLTVDHTTLETMLAETRAIEDGALDELQPPAPFRELVAQARSRVSAREHAAFFTDMLGDVDEPTCPFDLANALGGRSDSAEAHCMLHAALARAIRARTRALGVSAASLLHLAWALVLARTTGRRDVVFGTVLSGRMHGGAASDRALGLFINTLPVRLRIDDGVEPALRASHALLVQLLHHEHAPLSLAQRCSAIAPGTPLFTSLLNYRFSAAGGGRLPLQRVLGDDIALLGSTERTHYALSLAVDDLEDDFGLTARVNGAVAPDHVCQLMQNALAQLVAALDSEPQRPAWQLDVLSPAERAQLTAWSSPPATIAAGPDGVGPYLPVLFDAQVARTPDAIAVVYGEDRLSFRELAARANQLAHHLRGRGVGAEHRVALALERGVPMIVAILGVLKAGGAYVPLDPSDPAARIASLLDDARPSHLLTQASLRGLPPRDIATTLLDAQWHEIAAQPASSPDHGDRSGHQLAYLIYTSGSTGAPKGVLVEHRNVVHLWSALDRAIFDHHPACRRVSLNAPLAFDGSVKQWVQLLSGRTVVIVPAQVRSDGAALRRFLVAQAIDVFDCTPSQLRVCIDEGPWADGPAVTLVGGEAIAPALWQRLARTPGRAYYNVYGPAEATVDATAARITGDAPHIGAPIAGARVHILDDQLRPAPLGVAGELYIGGGGVARGYHDRRQLTAERFVDDPFANGGAGRLYRTGDRGRWRPDGTIELLGRNDLQVKIRGFRIEPGEIEAALAQVTGVRDVVVVAREDTPGDRRLVAYYTEAAPALPAADGEARAGAPGLDAEALRSAAARRLPPYMVPSAYTKLAALPRSRNGKLDRGALPPPDDASYARVAHEPPQGEIEQALAQIWRDVLQVERVGRRDRFFELGGHSLLAVRLVSRLRTVLGVEVPLHELFERPALTDMAQCVRGAARSAPTAIPRVARTGPIPLSLAQQRLWFLTQLGGAREAYHITGGIRLVGALDGEALSRALSRIASRHEALHTCFPQVDGAPVQRVIDAPLAPRIVDLRSAPDPAASAASLGKAHATQPFDLERALPVRALLLRITDDVHELHLAIHHIAADGWSIAVLLDELGRLYRADLAGQPDPLPPLALQYADFAAWQRGAVAGAELETRREFWRSNLAGAPMVIELPCDRARPAQQDHAGSSVDLALSAVLSAELRALARRHGVTLYMTVLAGWAATLGRLANRDEVVIGSPVAGRNRAEIEPLIGFFVNTLALRIDLGGEPTVGELLARTRAQVLAAQAHQDLPFDQVVEAVQPPRSLAHPPVFQVMLDWNAPAPALDLPGIAVSRLAAERTAAQFDLSLSLRDGDTLTGTLVYATALFDRATVERWVGHLQRVLGAMVADDCQPVSRLSLLSPAERRARLADGSAAGPRSYVLDRHGEPVPIGVVGELYLGADDLAGAAAPAIDDPFSPGRQMIRTGERARWRSDGQLERIAADSPCPAVAQGAAAASRVHEPPEGELERRIAQIWCEILGVAQVGRDDDFFALGGHSLLAIRVVERMRRDRLCVDVRALFTATTVAALAAAIAASTPAPDVEVPPNRIRRNDGDELPDADTEELRL